MTSAEIAASAGGVVDINRLGIGELGRRGIAAEYAPLGYVPAWDSWHREDHGERTTALTFMGAFTERRAHALARCVGALRGRQSAIHMVETGQPHNADSENYLAHERKWRLLANTEILLNIHQAEQPYMEWHRIIGAIANGCVVLSEESIGAEPLLPGTHFVSSTYDDLPWVLEGLLSEPERLQRIRYDAYDLLKEGMPMSNAVDAILRAVERAGANPVVSAPSGVAMPKPPEPRMPGWKAEAEIIGTELLPIRTALKHLVTQSRRVERSIRKLRSQAFHTEAVVVESFGPQTTKPRVSVLLTIYNYADYVSQALRSAALSEPMNIEVVAIDDASTDDSADAVRAACSEYPWLPVRLVRRLQNGGLSAARNLAAAHARSDFLFILDADNAVLPAGIRLLANALDEDPGAAFAYGVIETFDTHGPSGLISWGDWDPARLRYGNYIDAMAMIRRGALEQVGGYSTDTALSMGWEDFALWVAMADAGLRGIRVPDFVGRYRVNPHSMLSLTDIDNSAVWAALIRKYPSLAVTPDEIVPTGPA